MEYTVDKLARLSGVTTRTLRYYDAIGLLKPDHIDTNGYRKYGQAQVDTLQQILLFRELGVNLAKIKNIIHAPLFDRAAALDSHLLALTQKKDKLEILIKNVSRTIHSMKGNDYMKDEEKFTGLKQKMIQDNETQYGKEIREKFGDTVIEASNAKMAGMSAEQWQRQAKLSAEILTTLQAAMATGDPAGELAQKACDLHRQWLCMFWPEGIYSKAAHRALGETYVADPRFTAYYGSGAGPGAAEFLNQALMIYTR
jgi:DNA-binding transcriptional MerR regulator